MKVLVTGGTGTVGSLVVSELLQRDAQVRALVRKQSASEKLPEQVEVAVGDLMDPVSVEKALAGVDALFLLNAVAPDELTQGLIALGLAKKIKLKRVVYHSVFQADKFPDVPHFASKVVIEHALQVSGLPFTIIRPSYFFQNDLSLKDAITKAGVYPMPLGAKGVAGVDTRDIAEATAIALTSIGHEGKTYNLNGVEALSGAGVASIWSELLGKPVQYVGGDMDAFEEQIRKSGAPSWTAFDLRVMFEGFLDHGLLAEKGDVEGVTELLGHAPRQYRAFASEALAQWG
jgi:uncharacterized protein YbjT (DUF2867 family)